MITTTFRVTGMSCSHCEHAVTDEVAKIDGVTGIDVSAQTGLLAVDSDGAVSDEAVLRAVDEAGYSALRA
ncbi:heavy-metal-associated domain-containing protein [Humibacter ginsenosidimutans]|uniref:Heavy-metal-associated domain-containing protein n=1 Tax=Humibacter ginsenosidimutans TaxID=2599293 RepID=A0A5B8M2V6_9MICO|nr:heavy-metal-associated domain-containing protein [Humibacter ginsenosidimutans]QDZ14274.1 heavy-metal-associated domain-containing protein [Humibacter ginsenosidimutans]